MFGWEFPAALDGEGQALPSVRTGTGGPAQGNLEAGLEEDEEGPKRSQPLPASDSKASPELEPGSHHPWWLTLLGPSPFLMIYFQIAVIAIIQGQSYAKQS